MQSSGKRGQQGGLQARGAAQVSEVVGKGTVLAVLLREPRLLRCERRLLLSQSVPNADKEQ